jgi:poly-gamma-glutamate synthesis protein (capsule biosynthesis protein)
LLKKFIIFLIIILLISGGIGYALTDGSIDPLALIKSVLHNNAPENNKSQKDEVSNSTHTPYSPMPTKAQIRKLTLSFAGDVLLDSHVTTLIKNKGADYVAAEVKGILSESDISMVNLENPVSLRGTKAPNKQYTFRSNPENLDVLTQCGIDVVSLANNHTLDFGKDALIDTFGYLDKADIKYAGAGNDIESANKPVVFYDNGYSTSIFASSRVIPEVSWAAGKNKPGLATTYDPALLTAKIKEARKNSDIIAVYVHWGEELKEKPVKHQMDLAKKYIDSGADIVIGSHPHVLQGFEFYKGKLIVYSLGNFIFTNIKKDTMIINIEYTDNSYKARVIPCRIVNYRPVPINNETEKTAFYNKLESLSFNVDINDNGEILPKP